jgi:hypothetical protein
MRQLTRKPTLKEVVTAVETTISVTTKETSPVPMVSNNLTEVEAKTEGQIMSQDHKQDAVVVVNPDPHKTTNRETREAAVIIVAVVLQKTLNKLLSLSRNANVKRRNTSKSAKLNSRGKTAKLTSS